jgi:hypothetical protein
MQVKPIPAAEVNPHLCGVSLFSDPLSTNAACWQAKASPNIPTPTMNEGLTESVVIISNKPPFLDIVCLTGEYQNTNPNKDITDTTDKVDVNDNDDKSLCRLRGKITKRETTSNTSSGIH